MAPRAAAWVEWAEWICNYPLNGNCDSKESGLRSALFFLGGLLAHLLGPVREFAQILLVALRQLQVGAAG
jgi:hypothetical protein